MTHRIISIDSSKDIPGEYCQSPIGLLLEYHNLGKSFIKYERPDLLIGMCMDSRKTLRMPDNFAFILRSGGANLSYSEFKVSYAIAVGGVRHIALIGHSNCGMVNLNSKKDRFVEGLVEGAGWDRSRAEQHFVESMPKFEIRNEIDFLLSETDRVRKLYPKIIVAPLYYQMEDHRLYLVS